MEGTEEIDYQKEYDQEFAVYTQKRSQCESMERQLKLIREDIQELISQIQNTVVPQSEQNEPIETVQQELQTLTTHYQELNSKLNHIELQHSQAQHPQIEHLKGKLQELQQSQASLVYQQKSQDKEKVTADLSVLQGKIQEEEKKLKQKQGEVESQAQKLKDIQKQVAALNEVKLETGTSTDDLAGLEAQLAALEEEEAQLTACLKQEEAQLSRKAEEDQKVLKDELLQVTANNSHLSTTLSKLDSELKKLHLPKGIDNSEVTKLEDSHKSILKDIDELTKEVAVKKLEEGKRKEEAKKEKNREKRNFKQEIIEEQALVDLHGKELDRDRAKLQNTIKLRKSYVSQESLQILQKEYERQQMKGRPNLQTEEKHRQKVVKENQMIKARIYFLKHAAKELQENAESKLKEVREKGEELVKEKLANEKVFSDGTYKLKEYEKEFPDHEKKKEEAKNEEKRKRHELKEQKLDQQRKAAEKLKHQKEEQLNKLPEDANETSWEKWDKWDQGGNMPNRDEKSIFNNRQFQIAAAVMAVIAIVFLSFS